MEDNKKIILHIVFDGVLFDIISNRFDQMNGYKNIYLFNVYGNIPSFKFIKNASKVLIAKNIEEWGNIISNPNVDLIYFHGLWAESTKAVNYIRANAIVIWWCFGMEIYENSLGIAPILPLKLYKPKTFWIWLKHNLHNPRLTFNLLSYFFPTSYNFLKWIKNPEGIKNIYKMLERVDYLFTPLSTEYDKLIQNNKRITAKPFRLVGSPFPKTIQTKHITSSTILIDHSAVLTNNHADIFYALKKFDLSSRTLIIPISYGDDFIQKELKKYENYNGAHTNYLEKPLPQEEYRELIRNCSHAFFGALRQTGLGTIIYLLINGVKIFFYKDSIMFQHFKKLGYYVFSIEDLTEHDINTPLSETEIIHNYNLYHQIRKKNGIYEQQFDKLLLDKKNE